MSYTNYMIFGVVAVAIFTMYMAVVSLLRKDRNEARVKQIDSIVLDEDNEYGRLSPTAAVLRGILVACGVNLNKQRESVVKLGKAGYNTHAALVYFLFFKKFIQPVLVLIAGIILFKIMIYDHGKIKEHLALFLSGLIIGVIGLCGGTLFLTNNAQKRSKELIKTFPDALDLVLICVESGLGIDAAFARVCKEMKDTHPIVASEFERTRFEMTMMNDRVQALQNFSDRTGVGAVRSLVSSLIQAEKFGTSLIDTMRMIAEEQRTERMMNAEARAARLPALITMPLIFFILPGLFMIILGPAVIKLEEQGGIFGDSNK